MQIIGGIASRIKIDVPKGFSVRPTLACSRKALFDSIGNFEGLTVADFFSGSGALGLESASRGAENVYFIENLATNCRLISGNIQKVEKAGAVFKSEVICAEVISSFDRIPSPDIVFADPPYQESLELLGELLSDAKFAEWARNTLIVWELPDSRNESLNSLLSHSQSWQMLKKRRYGTAEFVFLRECP